MENTDPFKIENEEIKNNKLDGKYRHAWVEETFIFEKITGKQVKNIETDSYIGSGVSAKKINIILVFIILGITIILSRIFYLQILHGAEYKVSAENNRIRLRPIASERGLIYDSSNSQLVTNIPSFSLSIIPQDFPQDEMEREKVIMQVSEISGVGIEEIKSLMTKYKDYSYESLVVKENLDYESALKLYIENAHLPGILIEKGTKRLYDTGVFSLSHILGYLGKINDQELKDLKDDGYLLSDYIGKTGIEKQYESELRGTYGQRKVEVDAYGREQSVLSEVAPTPGKNLVLTIDLAAQKKLEEIVKNNLEKIGKTRASVVALDPKSGGIIAMVSWPTFDNNDFSGGISYDKYEEYLANKENPLFNRAIAGTYPSGSTAKLMIAAAALQEKIITKNTTVLSNGGIQIDRWFFPDWQSGGHGITNVTKAIAWSVNTFFYYIGGGYKTFDGLGVQKITEYLKKFGLGEKTGIDLPGEQGGLVPDAEWKEKTKDEMWYIGDTYNLSIGQGDLLVTPLQVANWTATIINGGKVYQPHLLKTIIDPVTKVETPFKVKVNNENFISQTNLNIVKTGMRECVTYGSCRSLLSLPFTSGGKTGTAQWSSIKENHGWFTAFAPYENPKIVVTAMVEEGEGGTLSATPIVKEFLAWWGKESL